MLPVSEVLFLFFTGRGDSFLSPKEKEKNGGAKRADRVVRPYKPLRRGRWERADEGIGRYRERRKIVAAGGQGRPPPKPLLCMRQILSSNAKKILAKWDGLWYYI